MDKRKEIEEMARDCGKLCDNYGSVKCANQDCKDCVRAIDVAQTLYERGYRNLCAAYPISDNDAINDTADLNTSLKVVGDRLGELIEKTAEVRKETAKEILQDLYDEAAKYDDETMSLNTYEIKQLAKKYGVEVDNE